MDRIAPNRKSVVAAVIAAHPAVDPRSDTQEGRGLLVDWVAQRLNAAEGRVVWGRKSRKKPKGQHGEIAVQPNTDGLTYLRPDGLFEIYDVIGGGSGSPTWSGYGPFKPGENGYWAPPQAGIEPGIPDPSPPPPPPTGDLAAEVAALRAAVAALTLKVKTLTPLEGARIALQTDTGFYLVAEGGGGGTVNANRRVADAWETFTVVKR
jgi:hypothetical protein